MKNVTTGLLIFLISLAFSYETIEYFSKSVDGSTCACISDFQCGEEESETKESNEKNEKLNCDDDLYYNAKYFNNILISDRAIDSWCSKVHDIFSSSDYSRKIYSPPEVL